MFIVFAIYYFREEQRVLTSMLSQLYLPSDAWIGLSFNQSQQKFKWSNNDPVTFTKWFQGQPNPNAGPYVKVGVGDGLEPMLWKPAGKDEKLPFFCQRNTGDLSNKIHKRPQSKRTKSSLFIA